MRENRFAAQDRFSRGASPRKPRSGGAILGFLIYSAWNFLALRSVLALIEWELSVFRTAGLAVALALWHMVIYGIFYAQKKRQ